MHVLADTWAHQGFAGVLHEINEVENAVETDDSGVFDSHGLQGFLNRILDDAIPPLGHGRANVFPDMPFLSWKYANGREETVERNNTDIFCEAADAICRAMQLYRQVQQSGICDGDKVVIRGLFTTLTLEDGGKRHRRWLEALEEGRFSFGPARIAYAEDGKGSWKAQALGTSCDLPVHSYGDAFLQSDWKLFHDALQLHRLTLLHDILPKYGICAA